MMDVPAVIMVAGPNGGIKKNVRELFKDSAHVQAAVNEAMRDVRILHKRMGVPLVGMLNARKVSIPPEEIEIDIPTGESDPYR